MPTYLCLATADKLTVEQKSKIANAITTAHSEEAIGPRYLVQVVFQAFDPAGNFIGGEPVPVRQIWIRGDIRAGRTEAQRSRLILRIASEVGDIAGSSPSDMWVYLNELLPENMVEFGHVLPLPGQEKQWFRALPTGLQERLGPFETTDQYI